MIFFLYKYLCFLLLIYLSLLFDRLHCSLLCYYRLCFSLEVICSLIMMVMQIEKLCLCGFPK